MVRAGLPGRGDQADSPGARAGRPAQSNQELIGRIHGVVVQKRHIGVGKNGQHLGDGGRVPCAVRQFTQQPGTVREHPGGVVVAQPAPVVHRRQDELPPPLS
ncbi:hypothetical protein QIS99_31055 [Streptomyces sp. B-S-A8]|uniref:Uncharacterized protein n=1 Tax=Streptomyces solicavernae TaxID=3043614 RepID=A0ABT6S1W3_9ACTN|nr:hypothetical protein [Streptomyces sp. B-S-A8]MDI3390600.1 hypothetical protein [Streptomyces sp. B-S-A8]